MQDRGSILPPLPKQDVLAQAVGGPKCAEKFASSSAYPSASRFGRYRPLGKGQSHLQGVPPTRYQNKANLHTFSKTAPMAEIQITPRESFSLLQRFYNSQQRGDP